MSEYLTSIESAREANSGDPYPKPGLAPTASVYFNSRNAGELAGAAFAESTPLAPGSGFLGILVPCGMLNCPLHLSSCIVGTYGACVYTIKIAQNNHILYDWQIEVCGSGPAGFGCGSLALEFTDGRGDTYPLNIDGSYERPRLVSYNSSDPAIYKVAWHSTKIS